ncbi:hypothetical protein BGZ80_009215 [Entomortierella chlamydospora]|uniref:Bud22 domain-containing protein n=1 Tax=Entomortierella chlamydospora TaxID=101097 RepID=A0A9P6MXK6_9FUNG|nr:hypothetical protein BGZ79_001518 [Entomortierella chlamydospora]KAG0016469.1 hypothetical protein BGZ80_009215 [Entomortierella chlamydospora]
MTMKNKSEHKGKKKDNLGWEIIKLQAQVGETNSRKAKKAVEAERKKEGISSTTAGRDSEEASEDASKALSEAAEKLLKLKEQKISQKIYQAKKEIRKAFVKAKGQETQRLIKRLKESRKAVESKNGESESTEEKSTEEAKPKRKQDFTAEDVAKFENELELVKKMDMDTLSEHAFVTKLAKHSILGSHQLMEPYVKVTSKSNGESTEKDSLIQIIEARLTNTKAVKEHMSKLWDEMEHIVTGRKVDHNELKKKRKAGNDQEEPESKKTKTKDTKGTPKNDNENKEDEDEEEEEEEEDVNMSDISDDEGYDDGYDSDGLPMPMNGKRKATTESSMFIGSLNAGNSKSDKKNKEKKGKKDKNDWVDEKFDEIYGKIKKNRPGQRARRMKAELKYGKEANHVKKAEEEARLREEKKAARKAKMEKFNASKASSANSQRLPNRRTIGAGDGSAAVHQPIQSKPKTPSGPDPNDPTLHPSWLAKQSEKAAMAAALSGAKSNKIVFDDSD